MTRRSDLMLEDLLGCRHELTLPVVDDDTWEILYWRCVCGAREHHPEPAVTVTVQQVEPQAFDFTATFEGKADDHER